MYAIVNSLRARLSDFTFGSLIVLGVVLWTAAPASAVPYIVSGIPFADYNSDVDTDMTIIVTYVSIDDPKNSALWYTSKIDIDITSISGILYGTTRRVTSPTPPPDASAGFRARTTPNPFDGWTCSTSCNSDTPTTIVFDNTTPLPAALPLFATGLGALGLLGWRRKRKNAAALTV